MTRFGRAAAALVEVKTSSSLAIRLSESEQFETIIVVLIGVSSLCLAIDVPRLPKDSLTKFVLDRLNYGFTAIFTFEMGLKMCARGFKEYFASFWNLLDFTLVMSSLLGLLAVLLHHVAHELWLGAEE